MVNSCRTEPNLQQARHRRLLYWPGQARLRRLSGSAMAQRRNPSKTFEAFSSSSFRLMYPDSLNSENMGSDVTWDSIFTLILFWTCLFEKLIPSLINPHQKHAKHPQRCHGSSTPCRHPEVGKCYPASHLGWHEPRLKLVPIAAVGVIFVQNALPALQVPLHLGLNGTGKATGCLDIKFQNRSKCTTGWWFEAIWETLVSFWYHPKDGQ